MKKREDVQEACPFPPGVDLPKKGGLNTLLGSLLVIDWRVIAPIFSLGVILLISGLLISPPIPFTSLKDPKTWNSTIPEYNTSFFPELSGWVPKYPKQIVHQGNLTLKGEERYLIENCTYILNGTFHASGNSSLVLKNSELWVRGHMNHPPYGDLNFTDSSTMMVYNSTIVSPTLGYGVAIILSGDSVADVKHSNVTFVSFNGDERSRIQIDHSTAGAIYVASNASSIIQNSDVGIVTPGGLQFDPDPSLPWLNQRGRSRDHAFFPWLNTNVKVQNSSINQLAVGVQGSRIEVNGSIPQMVRWDPSLFCRGGQWFNVSLFDSSVGTLLIFTNNTSISLEDSVDISYLVAVNCTVKVINSSIPLLLLDRCDSSLDNSVFSILAFFGDSDAQVKDSLANTLSLYDLKGSVECDGLKINQGLFGDNLNASVIGGLRVLEKRGDTSLFRFSRFTRGYQVYAEASGLVMSDVTLTLRDCNNTVVWSGRTGGSGQAAFNVTYYNLWRLGPTIWADDNMTSTLTLTAWSGDQQQVRNVTAESDTPIIFSFEKAQEPPIWGNRYALLIVGGLIITATVVYIFLVSKRRLVGHQRI